VFSSSAVSKVMAWLCCGAGWLGRQRVHRSVWCSWQTGQRGGKYQPESVDTRSCHHCTCGTRSSRPIPVSSARWTVAWCCYEV